MRYCLRLQFLIVVLLALVACEQPNPTRSRDVVKVGLLLDTESEWEVSIYKGVREAFALANQQQNCRYPKQLELIVQNTHSTPEGALKGISQLVSNEQVQAIIGPNISETALPVAKVAESHSLPMISVTSSHDLLTLDKQYVFQLISTNRQQSKALVNYISHNMPNQRLAVVYFKDSSYGTNFKESIENAARNTLKEHPLYLGLIDFDKEKERLIQQLEESNARLILLPMSTERVHRLGVFIKERIEQVRFMGTDYWQLDKLSGVSQLDGTIVIDHWYREQSGSQQSIKAFGTDAANLLISTVCQIEHLDSLTFAKTLAGTRSFNGITGQIKYFSNNQPIRNMIILKFENSGIQIVEQVSTENSKHQ